MIGGLTVATVRSVGGAIATVDRERDAWGTPATVWVARSDIGIGQPIDAEPRRVPSALRPDAAVDDPAGAVARQVIGRGEIVVTADVARRDDELAVVPKGWLVAPVEESPRSGVRPGDRVSVASDGIVVADEAIVVGTVDEGDGAVTLVALPADTAPALSTTSARVTLLRRP